MKTKGDKRGQNRRRKQRYKEVKKTINEYFSIDGNFTNHPVAYCTYYHGVLTKGQMEVHRCKEKECVRLREGDVFE